MKKIVVTGLLCMLALSFSSCSTNDVKEISGTMIFNDMGDHVFHINADNITATITMVGPDGKESRVYQDVTLYRTTNYRAKIEMETSEMIRTELLNNLVPMYELKSSIDEQRKIQSFENPGYIKIDWKGLN